MTVLFLGQVERELIVDGQIVCENKLCLQVSYIIVNYSLTIAGAVVPQIRFVVIGRIAFFALIPDQAFGTTMTFAGFTMTVVRVTTTLAFLTLPAVYRTAPVTVLARVTMRTSSQILK